MKTIKILMLFSVLSFTSCQSQKEQACDCLKMKENADAKYGALMNYPRSVKIKVMDCGKKFDGYNKIKRLCNG